MPTIKVPGRYDAKVIDANLGEASTGTPYASLYLETSEGAHIGAFLYLSEKAFDKSLDTLQEALKFDGNFENMRQCVGKPCSIVVEEDKDKDGKPMMRVRWINPMGGAKPAPEGLAARMTALARSKGATPAPTPAKAAAPAKSIEDADVPF